MYPLPVFSFVEDMDAVVECIGIGIAASDTNDVEFEGAGYYSVTLAGKCID